MPSKFAVTGGIGSGKSALCHILKERGHPVFSCDKINRALLREKDYLDGEVPLLFESGMPALFDGVIVVLREREERIRAVIARDGLTREQVEARIRDQFDYDGPLPEGCFVIENDGGEEALQKKADALLAELKTRGMLP